CLRARARSHKSRAVRTPWERPWSRTPSRASALPQVAGRPHPVGATLVANAFARERAPTRRESSAPCGSDLGRESLRARARSTSRGPSAPCGSDLGRERLRARARSHKSRAVRTLWERPWSRTPSRASALPQVASRPRPVGVTLVANAFARERAPTSRESSAPRGSDLGRERLRASALPQVAGRPHPVGATLVANAF